MAERGYKVGEALKAVAGEDGAAKPGESDSALAERIGRNFITALLDKVSTQAATGTVGGPPDPMDQADRMVGLIQKVRGLDGDEDDDDDIMAKLPKRVRRALRRLEDLDDDPAPRSRRGSDDAGLFKAVVDMQKTMMEAVRDLGDRFADALDKTNERTDKLVRELRDDGHGRGGRTAWVEEQMQTLLQQQLTRDPVKEYMQAREHFRQELGGGDSSIQAYLARERVGIERMRTQAEIDREGQRLGLQQQFVENMPMIFGGGGNRGQGAGGGRPLYRMVCGACRQESITDVNPATMQKYTCPKCGQVTDVPHEPGLGDQQAAPAASDVA